MAAAWLLKYGAMIQAAAGSDVPLAMLLGHVQLESGGRPNDHTKLDERGLFQIHPGTSKDMGFDHARMFEPLYSIQTGVDMFRRMAAKLEREYKALFPTRSDFFWHVVRFEFSIGSGATRQILGAMLKDGVRPRSWGEFTAYVERNQAALLHLTKHDPVKWSRFTTRVFETGNKLLGTGAAIGGGAIVLGLAAAALIIFLLRRERPPKHFEQSYR